VKGLLSVAYSVDGHGNHPKSNPCVGDLKTLTFTIVAADKGCVLIVSLAM